MPITTIFLLGMYLGAALYVAMNCIMDGDMTFGDTLISSLCWPAVFFMAQR